MYLQPTRSITRVTILFAWCPTKSKLLSFAITILKDIYKHFIVNTEHITVKTSTLENLLKQYSCCQSSLAPDLAVLVGEASDNSHKRMREISYA